MKGKTRLKVKDFEAQSPTARIAKAFFIDPLMNYVLPRKWLMYYAKKYPDSMLGQAHADPGGWRSMRRAYEQDSSTDWFAFVNGLVSTLPRALRNRKRLAVRMIAEILDAAEGEDFHIVGVGSGMGSNVIEGMEASGNKRVEACLVDRNSEPFEHGKLLAVRHGVAERVRFLEGDARDIESMAGWHPELVTLIGIVEYLKDDEVLGLLEAIGGAMEKGGRVIVNSMSRRYGTMRFLRRMFDLHFMHRTPAEVCELLVAKGFRVIEAHKEPLGVYHLLVGVKQ